MSPDELAHLIRASGIVTDLDDIIIVGDPSQMLHEDESRLPTPDVYRNPQLMDLQAPASDTPRVGTTDWQEAAAPAISNDEFRNAAGKIALAS